MIRRGKQKGWLDAPKEDLLTWAALNGCQANAVKVDLVVGKGLAIKATTDIGPDDPPLFVIPRELVLSQATVQLHAKADRHLREVLDALGSFGQTARGSIVTFLLMQATHLCTENEGKIGVSHPLSEYVKFLPMELLPTFWSQEELKLLEGTSLAPAMEAKTKSLFREYEHLYSVTAEIEWCKRCWWDDVDRLLSLDDWKQVDAFYRSRALEFPGIGDAMVPCIDMANHASGDLTSALYESDGLGTGLLLLRESKTLTEGEEVTITYGDGKGACEMIFSYGFLEEDVDSARDIFLDLQSPDDDPLARAKKAVASSAPGVRFFASKNQLRWESDYLWLLCVNEEDGLEIQLAHTVDGVQELSLTWQNQHLRNEAELRALLQAHQLWNVYQLRAVSLLQERVETQLRLLYDSEEAVQKKAEEIVVRASPRSLALRLRSLESELLGQFYEYLENEKVRLAQTATVQQYLNQQPIEGTEEDYS